MTTGYKTVVMAQAAGLASRIARERDVNMRVKLAFHLCQLLSDADKAIGEIIPIMEANDQYHSLLRLVEDAGITTIAADPETPLVLPDDGDEVIREGLTRYTKRELRALGVPDSDMAGYVNRQDHLAASLLDG